MPIENNLSLVANVDMTKPVIVVETFNSKAIGSFDTAEEAIAHAQAINVTAPGDSNYLIATTLGSVQLMQFKASPQPVDPRDEEIVKLKGQLAMLNAAIDTAQAKTPSAKK